MKIGADTGFFIALIEGSARSETYWNGIISGQDELIMSVLTIHELLVHFYKRGKGDLAKEWLTLLHTLDNVQILTVTEVMAEQSAGYRHGLGIPTVDSLIITTFVLTRCELVLSRDGDFEQAHKHGLINFERI
jgi:predicted nucleic acid-binding protein